ncbi:MAG: protein-L-isoaspartate(D-aspartate) O-methyltransferase [Marinobacter sp.]|uniref:protein-L-isoaspartate(D-aspartate) O-methyltransferase n=1 Tax=Marinobacter sp. TaxID=50741 RepID=UPI00299EC836|nr:protein-L-isoaspartate(D-aspartate) O-methyltransferase [Marinobacter sp.]MDX1755535.1 protein-L-isoaspartate(D-aspartate) O-methyltransferase [Marinobacter sp.]
MGGSHKLSEDDLAQRRDAMIEFQIKHRGITTPSVLDAIRRIHRESFVPPEVRQFAYDDAPMVIKAGHTLAQPYVIAMMVDALNLTGSERVLDVGTGSGYQAAILGCLASEVYSIERIPELAEEARQALANEGVDNVEVRVGDSSLGCPDQAPFDAIVVTAGGTRPPEALLHQLKVGGRMVIPLGKDALVQELVRVTRVSETEFRSDDIADIAFHALHGEFDGHDDGLSSRTPFGRWVLNDRETNLTDRIRQQATPFDRVEDMPLDALMERIGDARVVLIGEASHGTSEFYLARQRITRALIERKGFSFVTIEGDWPDAARVDHYVRHAEYPPSEWTAFARFPTWMWRNEEVRGFVDWLRAHNALLPASERVAFHGLDLYSMYNSIRAILEYLDDVDPDTATIARQRYSCLAPFRANPGDYGKAALNPNYETCEKPVLEMLRDLQVRHRTYAEHDSERFLNTIQNARLVANAEEYYRTMFYGSRSAWNIRDTHMFETLEHLLKHYGENSRAIVWAHNSHVGDSAATEMSLRDEFNIGRLCRARFGSRAYSIGFGTDTGTVAAASDWDCPIEIKELKPSIKGSYESLCHKTGVAHFLLPLRGGDGILVNGLSTRHLERAIGVIYRPETERQSHYFEAQLPKQFDEYIWLDQTSAVTPLATESLKGMPDTYPFGV